MSDYPELDIGQFLNMSTNAAVNLFSTGVSSEKTGGAVFEEGAKATARAGISRRVVRNPKLYPGVDINGALAKPLAVGFTTDSAMSVDEASQTMKMLFQRLSLNHELDGVQFHFISAMLLCMAVNSTSVLVPGRATFKVGNSTFDYFSDVVSPLGADVRRFFRAYADVTKIELQNLRSKYSLGPRDSSDEENEAYGYVSEMWASVLRVADARGLSRAPHLIHDTSEYCTGLTVTERSLIANSKTAVLSNTSSGPGNPVDNARLQSRAPSNKGYDTTGMDSDY